MKNNILKQLKDRVDDRTFKILENTMISLGIKGFSVLIGFITLPVYLKYLTNESVLGIWLTLISMIGWIFTFDLGIGNGLRNELTKELAQKNHGKAKILISSAYISSILICLLVILFISIMLNFINLTEIFKIDKNLISKQTVNLSIRILLISVLFQFVLKLICSILLAIHKSAIPNLLVLISNSALLIFMLIMPVKSIENNFLSLSIVYIVVTNVPLIVASVIVFSGEMSECAPSFKSFNFAAAKSVIKLGVMFLWLQIMYVIISNTNNFLISAFIGSKEVVIYQVYYKLFSVVSMFFMIGLTPIWSSVADALAKNDFSWIIELRKIH
jgi:O-antigen/teichoic acid export membrane protein